MGLRLVLHHDCARAVRARHDHDGDDRHPDHVEHVDDGSGDHHSGDHGYFGDHYCLDDRSDDRDQHSADHYSGDHYSGDHYSGDHYSGDHYSGDHYSGGCGRSHDVGRRAGHHDVRADDTHAIEPDSHHRAGDRVDPADVVGADVIRSPRADVLTIS